MKTKIKTIKAVAKRVRITKNNKMIVRKSGQDHFNGKESGKVNRQKKNDTVLKPGSITRNIKQFIPYN